MADGSQMLQVMQNLISNSLKFHGSEHPMVHISSKSGTKEWTFSVKDNGIGMSMEYSERIFRCSSGFIQMRNTRAPEWAWRSPRR